MLLERGEFYCYSSSEILSFFGPLNFKVEKKMPYFEFLSCTRVVSCPIFFLSSSQAPIWALSTLDSFLSSFSVDLVLVLVVYIIEFFIALGAFVGLAIPAFFLGS